MDCWRLICISVPCLSPSPFPPSFLALLFLQECGQELGSSGSRVAVFYSLGIVESPGLLCFRILMIILHKLSWAFSWEKKLNLSSFVKKKEHGIILMTKINSSAFGPFVAFTEVYWAISWSLIFMCVSEPVGKWHHVLPIVPSPACKAGKGNGLDRTEAPPGCEPIS